MKKNIILPILKDISLLQIKVNHRNAILAAAYKRMSKVRMWPGCLSAMKPTNTPAVTLTMVDENPIQPQSI